MKCPYQTKVIHKEKTESRYAEDITKFEDCWENDCPFFYGGDNCKKVEKELGER